MTPSSNSPLPGIRDGASRLWGTRHKRNLSRARRTSLEGDPIHLRLGLAFFGALAVMASITAGATALYVLWIVSQDFSA